jgi:ribosomal protein S1
VGSDVEVVVLEADSSGRRIRISRKAMLNAQDADELREYATRTENLAVGFGSLGDKLRGALGPRKGPG